MTADEKEKDPRGGKIGEGNVAADRRYREKTREFVEGGKVEDAARKAKEALEGPEGPDLERARRESAAHEPSTTRKRRG